MLAAISQVLNECTKPDQASPAAIVLQGLQALCEAEVRSNWLISIFHVLLVDDVIFPSVEFFFFFPTNTAIKNSSLPALVDFSWETVL